MCAPCTRHSMFFNLHACACEIKYVEALVQNTCVLTRRVHDNLHKHVCMSVMCTPNLVRMYVDINMNCKPMMMV